MQAITFQRVVAFFVFKRMEENLLQIVRTHVKLALEYGEPYTLPERKAEIKHIIQSLREERDQLISRSPEEETGYILRQLFADDP